MNLAQFSKVWGMNWDKQSVFPTKGGHHSYRIFCFSSQVPKFSSTRQMGVVKERQAGVNKDSLG